MREFLVMSREWIGREAYDGNEWDLADVVKASDAQEAVEKWAERDDQKGDYSIIGSGGHGPVKVQSDDGTVKEFSISAESCPVYRAREIKPQAPPATQGS